MEGFFCLKYLGHQECSFQDFVGFYKELTKSFDVFSGCFSWTCNIFDGESWVVYKAEYKSVRQEIPKNRRGKKRKSFHTHLFLKVFSPVAFYSNLMFKPIHDFDVISEECLQIFALPYTSPFHINYFFSPTCLQYLLMPIYYFQPAWGWRGRLPPVSVICSASPPPPCAPAPSGAVALEPPPV